MHYYAEHIKACRYMYICFRELDNYSTGLVAGRQAITWPNDDVSLNRTLGSKLRKIRIKI